MQPPAAWRVVGLSSIGWAVIFRRPLPRKIRADDPAAVIPNFPLFSKEKLVGATRIELVTPTMST
jgi:hypothetical protein